MKEIKFRGRDAKKGELHYGNLIVAETYTSRVKKTKYIIASHGVHGGNIWVAGRSHIDPETIEQFTGLYDKNNEPIYEGDVVITKYGRWCKVVWFSSPCFQGWDMKPFDHLECNAPDKFDLWEPQNLEVVTNTTPSNLNR